MQDKHPQAGRMQISPWAGMGLYLLLGVLWVTLGDVLLAALVSDPHWLAQGQMLKGWLYVVLTGLLAWWLLHRTRKAERSQSVLREQMAQIARYAPVGIARVDPGSMRILWANECLCDWLGMPLEQAQQSYFRDWVVADDRAWVTQQLERLLEGDIDSYQGERLVRQVGTEGLRPVLCSVSRVADATGQAMHCVCVLVDMTEMGVMRTQLERSETVLRLALDGSGGGMWDWDVLERRSTYSEGMARLLRYDGTQLPSDTKIETLLHADDQARVQESARLALRTGQPFDASMRLLRYDGSYGWFHARGLRHLDGTGKVVRFSGILFDLTDRRDAEERQRLASTVVDNSIEAVLVTDTRHRILSVNAVLTRVLGYTEQELLGQTPRLFKSGRHDKVFYDAMWDAVNRTGHWQGEIWNKRKNGEIFPEHMSLSAVKDAHDQVTHYVCMFTDISEEKAQRERLEFLAHYDTLTGLPNRRWFTEHLSRVVQQAETSGEIMAVLLVNLDRFKDVNDSYGHSVGDLVLKHITHQVRGVLRPGDLIGRLSGDEFAVLGRNLRSQESAAAMAQRLIAAVAEPWTSPEGIEVVAVASVGICMFPEHGHSADLLLQGAHAAVYGAKARGRGTWCFFDEEMTQAARERLELEARLRLALSQGHLQLYYQPQLDIQSGRIMGAEALLRWIDPEEGLIPPGRFIPVAESSGVIGPIGQWVLNEACHQAEQWRREGLAGLTVAVNISPRQFQLTDLVSSTRQALQDSGLRPEQLELELTESALAERPEETRDVLLRLKALGVRMAVDDFGTGYSSLAHLKRFPIDVLKIDQGFIREIPTNRNDMAISAAIIAMSHSLELMVLAEGVETPEQLAFLRERGCDRYQGYLFSRPIPASEFTALLRAQAGVAPAATAEIEV